MADVHEQRKPWVPLILEASYRPNGWLGIMLGSRLYYEFTKAALVEHASWERLVDSVAVEVRRRHPPSAGGVELQAAAPEATLQPGLTAASAAAPSGGADPAARESLVSTPDAAPRGIITVSSNVVNSNSSSVRNESNCNFGNSVTLILNVT